MIVKEALALLFVLQRVARLVSNVRVDCFVDSFKLGSRGDRDILLFPADTISGMESRPLQWDLWVFRIFPA